MYVVWYVDNIQGEGLQSIGQGNGVIYADISQPDIQCTHQDIKLRFHSDLSLDDRVEYVEVKHQLESSKCDKIHHHETGEYIELVSNSCRH